jgi:peptidoglycan hydrolase-like protein with peptidoglycan-binding domain
MRSMLTAIVMIAAAGILPRAQAQTGVDGLKPKPVVTVPIRPAPQTPADTATTQAERQAVQSDLAWTGDYNGVISGEASDRTVAAIKSFQKKRGGQQTGVLNPQERVSLADAAKRLKGDLGWKIVTDPGSGVRLGLPSKLVPQQSSDANGVQWRSSTGTIQIQLTRRKEASPATARLADQEKQQPAGRQVTYSVVKPDYFVLSGTQGPNKFYVRGQFKDSEVRILTILYDQASEATMAPAVIAMSSAFNPFPAGAPSAPRKTVDYGTGIVVSEDGAVVTDRQIVDGCLSVVIAGYGNADRVAEDKAHDLALLRLYGARGLKALGLGGGAAKSGVDIIGIADPQNQGGRAAASSVRSLITPNGSDLALAPAPGLGFSGAAVLDGDGKFAGMALLKPVIVAGPANGTPAAQAALVHGDIVRDFIKANGVTAVGSSSDAKASVVRVICVRN